MLRTSKESIQFVLVLEDLPVLRAEFSGNFGQPVRGRLPSFPIGDRFLLQRSNPLLKSVSFCAEAGSGTGGGAARGSANTADSGET